MTVVGGVQDGLEAIRVAEEVRPHVVLMGVYMPRMDGIQSTRHIHARVPESCIIGMSSDSRAWVEDAFRSAGAHAFLPKELVPSHLSGDHS